MVHKRFNSFFRTLVIVLDFDLIQFLSCKIMNVAGAFAYRSYVRMYMYLLLELPPNPGISPFLFTKKNTSNNSIYLIPTNLSHTFNTSQICLLPQKWCSDTRDVKETQSNFIFMKRETRISYHNLIKFFLYFVYYNHNFIFLTSFFGFYFDL